MHQVILHFRDTTKLSAFIRTTPSLMMSKYTNLNTRIYIHTHRYNNNNNNNYYHNNNNTTQTLIQTNIVQTYTTTRAHKYHQAYN